MVLINYAGREINAKIVYYGPGLSGKTTNLECIYASVPSDSRGKMVSMKTRQDRTLFFDFLPLELGEVHGFKTRFLLYTVPGQVFYNATRKLVLKGADAVVFVADSQRGKMEENQQSLQNLRDNLAENNLALDGMPWVLQYNKRDLADVHPVEELQQALNPGNVPFFEASAATGRGVYETLHAVSKMLFQRLVTELRPGPGAGLRASMEQATRASNAGGARRSAPAPGKVAAQPHAPGAAPVATANPAPAAAPTPAPAFGSPGGNVPAEPTSRDILDSVEATSQTAPPAEGGAAGPEGEYQEYGHVVDLGDAAPVAPPAPAPADGFIKDPLRRSQPRIEVGRTSGAAPETAPTHTFQVPVTIPQQALEPGTTIRIQLDLRIEPS